MIDIFSTGGKREATALSPRVKQVVQLLNQGIERGQFRPGDRLPPLRSLAQRVGESYGVVQLAIRHLQSNGTLQARQGSGTFVASSGDVARSTFVHLLIYGRQYGFAEAIEPMMLAHQDRGLTLLPTVYDNQSGATLRRLVDSWREEPPRAVIVKGSAEPIIAAMRGGRTPRTRFITVYGFPTALTERWHNVRPDEATAFRMAAAHLIARGHRRIGMPVAVDGEGPPSSLAYAIDQKVMGISKAFEEAGLPNGFSILYKPVLKDDDCKLGLDRGNVVRQVQWLTAPDGPTAVIDRLNRLASLRLAMREARLRMGEDIEIVGIGEPSPAEHAEFSCVSEDHAEAARQIVNLIVSDDPDMDRVARQVIIPPQLIARMQYDVAVDESWRELKQRN